ncbi:MAG TPA: VWA domain-containing protein [Thermoanaerobaculia bacterium]|nr:VWA domain-containing protein [Thermoanaerobaculia bacterium]
MNARTLALALTAAAWLNPLYAQFGETVEVRVTNVEAIVTDRSGKPVPGLTRDDFEIYENGVRQEISNFAEIREEAPSATMNTVATDNAAGTAAVRPDVRRRLITVFIDNASLEVGNRAAILPQLRRFLTEHVRPGDGVSIAVWGGNALTVELEPTSDRAAIAAAVERLAGRTTRPAGDWRSQMSTELNAVISAYAGRTSPACRGGADCVAEKPPFSIGLGIASSYANRAATEMRQKSAAIQSVIASLRGVEGRKILVLLTQSLSRNPGEEPLQILDTIKEQFGGEGRTFNPMSEARIHDVMGIEREIAAAANGSGITLYPIHAAGKFADSDFLDPSVSTSISSRPVLRNDTTTPTLQAVAADTGGVALIGSTNWQLAFDTIANDLNTYYSLGYRTSGERQDRMKNVDVRLKNKRYTIRTRKAVVEQTASSEMSDSVMANLFFANTNNDLAIKATPGTATAAADGTLVLPLTITIPMQTLTLLPDGEDLVGRYSVFAAFLRQDGAVSRVANQTQQFRFPASSLARRKELTVKLDVTTDARTGAISVGVVDETSRATGYTLVKLAQPAQ